MNSIQFNSSEIDNTRLMDVLRKTLIQMEIPFEDKPGGIIFSKELETETYSFEALLPGFDDILSKNTWVYNSGLKNRLSKTNTQRSTGIFCRNSAEGLNQSFRSLHITIAA